MKKALIRALPEPAANFLRNKRDEIVTVLEWPAAFVHPWRQDSIQKIKSLKNSHLGEQCVIIGNGPSLRETDLSKLHSVFTIGMNRIYLAFPEMGFATSYLVSVNDLVVEQCANDFQALPLPKFVSWRNRKWISPADNLHYLYTSYLLPGFNPNATGRLWEGATVTFVALQLAYYLGFKQVILIGVDHCFSTQGTPNSTVVSMGDDPNHFNPSYFGKGFRWQLPDLETSELAYAMARDAFHKDGREILDATKDGKLTIFPKVKYDSLF